MSIDIYLPGFPPMARDLGGPLGGLFVGLFHNGTSLPMVLTMAGFALAGRVAFWCASTEG